MEELLNFRLLSDELTQTEYISFLTQSVLHSNARSIITKCLFESLKTTPKKIIPFNNIISNIIQKRDEDEENESTTTPTNNISNLPSSLISECGSFLKMDEYFRFSQCNRKTYIALHQQPKLIEFLPDSLPSTYNLKIFRNCQKIDIDSVYFNDSLSVRNQATWRNNDNLKTLILGNQKRINIFLNRKLIKMTNLKQLALANMNYNQSLNINQSAKTFIDILSHFPMITVLDLSNIVFNTRNIANNPFIALEDDIKENCKNLTALGLCKHCNGSNVNFFLCQSLINAVGDRLEAISIPQLFMPAPPVNGWRNLKELVLWRPTLQIMKVFIFQIRHKFTSNGYSLQVLFFWILPYHFFALCFIAIFCLIMNERDFI